MEGKGEGERAGEALCETRGRDALAEGLRVGRSAQALREEMLSRHKAARKQLRAACNERLLGKKGAERAEADQLNAREKQKLEASHSAELAAFESDLEAARAMPLQQDMPEEDASIRKKKEKAQQRREKKQQLLESQNKEMDARSEVFGPSQREIEDRKIQGKLASMGLALKEVQPDGHCLFRAVAEQVIEMGNSSFEDAKDPHLLLRAMSAQYMKDHQHIFEPFIAMQDLEGEQGAKSFDEYVDSVKNTAAWGGQLELRALAGVLGHPIKVINANSGDLIIGEDQSGEHLIVTYHHHYLTLGEHYNTVEPSQQGGIADG